MEEIQYFFATNGLDVHAIDSSKVAIENIYQKIREKNISLNLKHFEARRAFLFFNSH